MLTHELKPKTKNKKKALVSNDVLCSLDDALIEEVQTALTVLKVEERLRYPFVVCRILIFIR